MREFGVGLVVSGFIENYKAARGQLPEYGPFRFRHVGLHHSSAGHQVSVAPGNSDKPEQGLVKVLVSCARQGVCLLLGETVEHPGYTAHLDVSLVG